MPDSSVPNHQEVPNQTPLEKVPLFGEKRTKLRDWITSKSSFLGGLYEGAVIILYSDPPLPGWPHFTSHAVREIRNRLPDCVAATESVGRLDYHQEVRKISAAWKAQNLPFLQSIGSGEITTSTVDATFPVPREIYDSLSKMVKDDSEVQDRKYRTANRLFQALVPEGEFGEKEPIIQQWIEVTDWFASSERTHAQAGGQQTDGHQEYTQRFEMVEHILLGLIESSEDFSQLPAELNEILENTNN